MSGRSQIARVVLLAAAAWQAGATPALAVPAAALAVVGLTGAAATVAAGVLNFALAQVAASFINRIFAPRQGSAVAEQQASVTTVAVGETPAQVVLGRALVGGTLADAFNWGPQNEWETQVIVLADHEVDGLEGVLVNDAFVPMTGGGYLPGFRDEELGRDCLLLHFANGGFPAAPPPEVLTAEHDWTGADRMHGRTWVAVSYFSSPRVFPQGRPRLAFQLRGAKLYDPRLDSTVPGGAGAQRFTDRTTWTWSENAELIHSNFMWGIWTQGFDGTWHLMAGPGRPLAQHPAADVIARANLCDELVGLRSGGAERRWRLSAVVDADRPWRAVLEDFATSCAGDLVERQGLLVMEAGAARVQQPAFTDAALIAGQPVKFVAFQPADRVVNTVTARYVEPAQQWKSVSAPVRRSLEDIAADGRPRELTLDLKHCTSGAQAQRVAEIARRQARCERTATVVLGPRFMGLEAGDWQRWQSDRRFGPAAISFKVAGVDAGEDGVTAVTLQEVRGSTFAWNAAVDELPPGTAAFLPSAGRPPLAVAGFAANAGVEMTGAGLTAPVIAITWTPVTDPSCVELRAELRRTGATAVETRVFGAPAAGAETWRGSLDHDQSYDVRLVPIVSGVRRATPTAWLTVTTDALTLLDVQGLAASARPDGVALSWTASSQPEAVGYDVRAAASPAATWADAQVVQQGFSGNALFVARDDAAPVTFIVRARDRSGRLSPEGGAARVTARVTAPGDVTAFDAAPNGELVRFTWGEVDGASDGYEIRAGFTWETGRVVDRPSGYSTSVLWPIVEEDDSIFWIKALSRARLYSVNARIFQARTAPTSSRNIVFSRDYAAAGWPGVRHDLSIDGALLTLDRPGGVSAPFGDYYDEIPLSRSFFARAWINVRAASLVGESPRWSDLAVPWSALGEATWEPPLGDAGTARLDAFIAPALLALPDTLVDGFRLRTADAGVRGTPAALSVGVTRAPCRVAPGAALGPGAVLGWDLAVPGVFSVLFDAAPTGDQSGVGVVLTVANTAGGWLQVTRDAALGRLALTADTGESCFVSAPFVAGDVVSIGLYRAAGEMRLFAATRRDPVVRQAGVAMAAAPAAWTQVYLAGPASGAPLTWAECSFAWNAPAAARPWAAVTETVGAVTAPAACVVGDLEVHSGATAAAVFDTVWARRGPVGFEAYRTFQPGDYRIAGASVWLRLSAPDPVAQTLAIPAAEAFVDVPDVIDRVLVTIGAGDTVVPFTRAFYAPPEVVATWRGGAVLADVRVVDVQADHAVVRLVSTTDFETAVAGDVSLIAAGY